MTDPTLSLEPATDTDRQYTESLLSRHGLPTDGLLRSVVVEGESRGGFLVGLGSRATFHDCF